LYFFDKIPKNVRIFSGVGGGMGNDYKGVDVGSVSCVVCSWEAM